MKNFRFFLHLCLFLCSLNLFLFFSCASLPPPYTGEGLRLTVQEALDSYGLPKVTVDFPESYFEGDQWGKRAAELIYSAKESIISTVFLGSYSPQSAIVLDALSERAREGLAVYLIIDSISNLEYTASSEQMKSLHRMRIDGVHLLEFNPFTGERILMLQNLLLREHRKFLIIDGTITALGGMNYNYVSLHDSQNPNGQRDSMYVFNSPSLSQLLLSNFIQFWNEQSWDTISYDMLDEKETAEELDHNAWVADQFNKNESVKHMFNALIDAADHEIVMLPFLPFLDKNMSESIKRAIDRGVSVKMLVPWDMRKENRMAVQYAALDLLDLGVELYREHEPAKDYSYPLLHEKLMVVDYVYTMVGSSNYNFRSMNLSNELSIVVESEQLNQQSRAHLSELFSHSRKITREEALTWRRIEVLPNYWFTFIGG